MSKGLASYPEHQRIVVATRRLVGNTHGNGFWGARDFFDKKKMKYPPQSDIGKAQAIKTALENASHDENGGYHIGGEPTEVRSRHPRGENDRPAGKARKGNNRRQRGTTLSAIWPKHGTFGSDSMARTSKSRSFGRKKQFA